MFPRALQLPHSLLPTPNRKFSQTLRPLTSHPMEMISTRVIIRLSRAAFPNLHWTKAPNSIHRTLRRTESRSFSQRLTTLRTASTLHLPILQKISLRSRLRLRMRLQKRRSRRSSLFCTGFVGDTLVTRLRMMNATSRWPS